MEIIYTSHLIFRLGERNIPYELPQEIFEKSEEHYFDNITRHYIAIYEIEFKGKVRDIALTYDWRDNIVELVTIHPINQNQKQSRINSGRWRQI